MIFTVLLYAVESRGISRNGVMVSKQCDLMLNFFSTVSDTLKAARMMLFDDENLCPCLYVYNYEGVRCRDGKVIALYYKEYAIGNFALQFAPPTVEKLTVDKCLQRYSVDIRMLPREARHVDLSRNEIFGRIDLEYLPRKIEYFDISFNQIRTLGPFVNLPPMDVIDISHNVVKQDFLIVSAFPSTIYDCTLQGPSMRIGGLKSYWNRDDVCERAREVIKI